MVKVNCCFNLYIDVIKLNIVTDIPRFVSSVADDGDALCVRAARCKRTEDVEGESSLHGVVMAPLNHTVHATSANQQTFIKSFTKYGPATLVKKVFFYITRPKVQPTVLK